VGVEITGQSFLLRNAFEHDWIAHGGIWLKMDDLSRMGLVVGNHRHGS
jgi:hypothetical protein